MNEKISKRIFITLFAILYISVAFVSTFHAIAFFGLANLSWIAVMLAITFEIGQAAVLFSILTGASGKSKVIPWILMCVLTLVQVLGNVYSSYQYLITNSADLLRYFKEPIFVWTDAFPDQQCNVILTYIIGAILPIVSLLMTSMVTNYIGKKPEPEEINIPTVDNPPITNPEDYGFKQNEKTGLYEKVKQEEENIEEQDNTDIEEPTKEEQQETVRNTINELLEKEEKVAEKEQPIEESVTDAEPITEETENPLDFEQRRQSHFINL